MSETENSKTTRRGLLKIEISESPSLSPSLPLSLSPSLPLSHVASFSNQVKAPAPFQPQAANPQPPAPLHERLAMLCRGSHRDSGMDLVCLLAIPQTCPCWPSVKESRQFKCLTRHIVLESRSPITQNCPPTTISAYISSINLQHALRPLSHSVSYVSYVSYVSCQFHTLCEVQPFHPSLFREPPKKRSSSLPGAASALLMSSLRGSGGR